MEQILTSEEKKYLNRTCNYLASLGMTEGVISIEMDSDQYDLSHEDIDWKHVQHFENNYRAELPEGLIPILKKVMNHVIEEGSFDPADVDTMTYQNIDIEIDCTRKELTVSHNYSYYDRGDSSSIEYDSKEEKERFDKWMEEDMQDVGVPSDGILTLSYNGGGDSGYIESSFDETSDAVPASIENWCYSELERHFGGWEINEGSDGRFIFNFNNSTVELDHTYNTEENESHTLFEENFSI
jgi:hypothetical protein